MWHIEKFDHANNGWMHVRSFILENVARIVWDEAYSDLNGHRLVFVAEETFA